MRAHRRSHATTAIASLVTERDWQRQVTDAAELFGWTWAHFRPARTERGWRTPVSGPIGAGFPDLILARGSSLIFAELKSQDGRLTQEQRDVLDVLGRAVPVYTWRPSDLPAVLEVLRSREGEGDSRDRPTPPPSRPNVTHTHEGLSRGPLAQAHTHRNISPGAWGGM